MNAMEMVVVTAVRMVVMAFALHTRLDGGSDFAKASYDEVRVPEFVGPPPDFGKQENRKTNAKWCPNITFTSVF